MAENFEDYKKELQKKLEQGYVLDEDKLDSLKEAYEQGKEINIQDFSKPQAKETKPKTTRIDEGAVSEEERSNAQEGSWKELYAKEWRVWGEQNALDFKDASIPSRGDALSFRFHEGKDKEYAAEITYETPYNLSIKGNNGKIPDTKYFEKAVNMAVSNGTAIEFGTITSPEFKAKLLAACYKQAGAQIVNGPTEEEIAKWPEDLKKMVA